ncbi:hypothetical protein [Tardiphaga sp. 367_B4_N1_1]|uniref:hypothetical protein n=1 Tax=Tardiphaga sp. 367_B4_N1_1 TaxID=3240777 RepID=UPI003F1EB408
MSLPSPVEEVIGSSVAEHAFLVKFDFVSETKRVWTGFSKLRTLDGQVWDGLGELVSISGLSGMRSGSAPAGKITASGVSPDLLPIALGESDEYQRRPVAIFFQAFANRVPVYDPCPLLLRIMTTISIDRTGDTRSLSINHESPYVGRNNPANGWYSDRDQQTRYPGDRFCERAPFLFFKQERWPDY